MTITKAQLIEEIRTNGFTMKKAAQNVEPLLELFKKTLESGGDVLISGFEKILCQSENGSKGKE